MSEKPQTNKDMLVMILENQLALTKEVAEVKGQVAEINHTIHNGMSSAIHETAQRVTTIDGDLSDVKLGLERIITEGHPNSCPFLADQKQRKLRFWSGLARWKKAVVWVFGLGGALYAWAQFITYINGQ